MDWVWAHLLPNNAVICVRLGYAPSTSWGRLAPLSRNTSRKRLYGSIVSGYRGIALYLPRCPIALFFFLLERVLPTSSLLGAPHCKLGGHRTCKIPTGVEWANILPLKTSKLFAFEGLDPLFLLFPVFLV